MKTLIKAGRPWWRIDVRELIEYRELLGVLVRRDFVAVYKQTALGPLWFILQPLAMTLVFTVIFGRVASIGTDGAPEFLFYLCGIAFWSFFSYGFTNIANVLHGNAHIFGKVYFPRLLVPLSIIVNGLIQMIIHVAVFLVFFLYYRFATESRISPNAWVFAAPFLLIHTALVALGAGLWMSALTVKFRDLRFALPFLTQMWMFLTPIVYPASRVSPRYYWLLGLNPLAFVMEIARLGCLGAGTVSLPMIVAGLAVGWLIFISGALVFNRVERTFVDTI